MGIQMKSHRLAVLAAATLSIAPAFADTPSTTTRVVFDATRLREGVFKYELRRNGELLGTSTIEVRRETADEFLILMDAREIAQRWSARIGRRFNPLAAKLEMFTGAKTYRMSLLYSDTQVSGTEIKQGPKGPLTTKVKATIQLQVDDQREDLAAMMAAQFGKAKSIEFDVYDPGTGFSRLVGTKADVPPIAGVLGKLPAIRFDYTIHKKDHAEVYSVYATQVEPRIMLREEMPNGLVALLVATD
jgi:hypothetical protein